MESQDKVLICTTCGREFSFTSREQEFYQEKGFIDPKHCRECRQQRKMRREALAKESPVGIEPGTQRALFEVICAECGKRTQVPFKPLTGKPILCKDCFILRRQQIEHTGEETEVVVPLFPETEVPEIGDVDKQETTTPIVEEMGSETVIAAGTVTSEEFYESEDQDKEKDVDESELPSDADTTSSEDEEDLKTK